AEPHLVGSRLVEGAGRHPQRPQRQPPALGDPRQDRPRNGQGPRRRSLIRGHLQRAGNHLFTSVAAQLSREQTRMAQAAEFEPDRRRAARSALRLTATMREGSKSRVQARVIDISTHGCRIECTSTAVADAWIWLSIAGLETQYCRVVWHCQEFIGLEF